MIAAEVARLKQRVDVLEKAAFSSPSEHVEGWTGAAKLLGVTERTVRRRYEAGTLPKPCRFDVIKRTDGPDHERPVWKRADLLAYAEGK